MHSPNKTLSRLGFLLGVSNQARYMKAIKSDRRRHPADYEFADQVLEAFHSQGGLKQYTQSYKLVSLTRMLIAERPSRVLELGTGSSSIILAKYARELGAKVIHVDEDEKWLDNTKKNIEKFVGPVDAEFVRRPSQVDTRNGVPHFWYSLEIDARYDMIFVDGPALYIDGKGMPDGISFDVLKMAPDLLPDLIAVDLRAPTVKAMAAALRNTHGAHVSDILTRTPRPSFQYFSVFRKKTERGGSAGSAHWCRTGSDT